MDIFQRPQCLNIHHLNPEKKEWQDIKKTSICYAAGHVVSARIRLNSELLRIEFGEISLNLSRANAIDLCMHSLFHSTPPARSR